MADITGKAVTLLVGDGGGGGEVFTTVAAATTHSLSISNSEVEFNTKDSGGWRDLFPTGSIKNISISASFQFTNTADQDRVKTIAMAADSSANFKFRDGSGEEFSGNFQITSFDLTGETEGFATFDISLSSNGIIVLQAES